MARKKKKQADATVIGMSGSINGSINANNYRMYALGINIEDLVAALSGDGYKPIIRKAYLEINYQSQTNPAIIKAFAVRAVNGATFTASDVVDTNNVRAGLDACIDKSFGYRHLGDIRVRRAFYQSKNAADAVRWYDGGATLDVTGFLRKLQKEAEQISPDSVPESFIAFLLYSQGDASSYELDYQLWVENDNVARTPFE